MITAKYIGVVLGLLSLSACQKGLTFEIALAAETTRYSEDTQQESVACDIGIYAINEMDFGVKIAPELTIFTDNEQYTMKIKSWGDDWDYLIGKDGDQASRQGLCFKEINQKSFGCDEVLSALRNKQYKLTLNRCEKLDQSPLDCEIDVELANGGIRFKKDEELTQL
ncbi:MULTISPECIES: hypothetical protein [unclassified Shewanella]|jgi:hypothetical protein|uniref:hypothetical protein n=1 Tax=unclassified Shewanella TaxID=196818 RepID=UPI000C7C0C8B|nr:MULTISPECIES: hypothetical protein [unclassified Shewanella]PKG56131.1 hypothetical protein CXF82_16225 [Shewanella sp. GutDb-MelDb]PKG73907.1 hypothetical protein CXF86_14500 [Shewanella sp. GutCb]